MVQDAPEKIEILGVATDGQDTIILRFHSPLFPSGQQDTRWNLNLTLAT